MQNLCNFLKGRVLGFNVSTAHVWGQLKASWDQAGVVIPSLDSQLAATAQRHQLTLVTHNTTHFDKAGVEVPIMTYDINFKISPESASQLSQALR